MPYVGRMSIHEASPIPEWTLADRLRKAREMTGLSQQQFAEKLGVTRNTVGSAEKGGTVRRITLNAWAMATGVPVEWLESGDSPAGPPSGPGGGLEDTPAMQALARSKRSRSRAGTTHRYLPTVAAA